jgi:hypothetical protein
MQRTIRPGSRKSKGSSNRTRKYRRGGSFFRLAGNKIRDLQKGVSNIGENINKNAKYAVSQTDDIRNKFNALANAPSGSPEYNLVRSVDMRMLMTVFLVRVNSLHAIWIPFDDKINDGKRSLINIKKIFGMNTLNYSEKSSGCLISNKEHDTKTKTSFSGQRDGEILGNLNKIMGFPCNGNVDKENDAYIEYNFKATNGSSAAETIFLTIICKDYTESGNDKFGEITRDFTFHLGKIAFFGVKNVVMTKKTDVSVGALINILLNPSNIPSGIVNSTGEFAIRDHITKYISGENAKFSPSKDTTMMSLYKSYYGNERYEDLYGEYTSQSKLINFNFNFNSPLQRGILIAILLDKKASTESPDEFHIEDLVRAFEASS